MCDYPKGPLHVPDTANYICSDSSASRYFWLHGTALLRVARGSNGQSCLTNHHELKMCHDVHCEQTWSILVRW